MPTDSDEQVALIEAAGATKVHTREFDADDVASHGPLVASIVDEHGPIDTAVLAFGILGDQARAEVDAAHAVAVVHTDYVAQVSVLTHLATAMRTAGAGRPWWCSPRWPGCGCAVPIMSRSPRLAWTASPAGWPTALHGTGVRLLIARPDRHRAHDGGDDARTDVQHPEQVAAATARALAKGRRVVWIPWALRGWTAVRLLPQAVWRRMPR